MPRSTLAYSSYDGWPGIPPYRGYGLGRIEFVGPIPVLSFFNKLTVPSPETEFGPRKIRTLNEPFVEVSNEEKVKKNPRDQPHRAA